MKKNHARNRIGTPLAIATRMTSRAAHTESMSRPTADRPGGTLVSLVAAKAGREVVWVLIAGAFFLVEALVFLTELPTARFFHRRETAKTAGHSRR
jgi:hypothetical protein